MARPLPARTKAHGAALLPMLLRPRAVWRFLRRSDTPKLPKLGLLLAVLYVLWPLDLIPDVAPLLSWLDDAGVATLAIGWLLSRAAEAEADAVALEEATGADEAS